MDLDLVGKACMEQGEDDVQLDANAWAERRPSHLYASAEDQESPPKCRLGSDHDKLHHEIIYTIKPNGMTVHYHLSRLDHIVQVVFN